MTGAEQVVHRGQTLYAPLIACRPVDPLAYPEPEHSAWLATVRDAGFEPLVYPASVVRPCEACAIGVWVGPRQQEAVALAAALGLAAHVLCMLHAVDRQRAARDAVEPVGVEHLGNLYVPGGAP